MTKKTKKFIVNGLSLARILVAIILPFLMFKIDTTVLTVFLIILLFTDTMDGFLARKWEVSTVGGALLDQIGDKVLAISMVLSLCKWYKMMLVLFILELIISIINVSRVLEGKTTGSTYVGKVKTWFLGVAIMLVMLNLFFPNEIENPVLYVSMTLAIIMELVTIVSYIIKNRKSKVEKIKKEYSSIKGVMSRLFDENAYKEDVKKPLIELLTK